MQAFAAVFCEFVQADHLIKLYVISEDKMDDHVEKEKREKDK